MIVLSLMRIRSFFKVRHGKKKIIGK